MKKIISALICLSSICLCGESINEEWDRIVFLNKKNLGLSLCIREFYKNQHLPKEIENAELAFSSIEVSDPDDKERFLKFIKSNIHKYMPKFKHPELFPQHWYFVACLNMYNSKEYEDMIQRKRNVLNK